ncbi:5'/3'-nucleotidase SurE [Aspergillus affinis]|uniref:5'/3'-nucleotidase SurE n=1 Tax=Aspergillus affinis TaxID=1070780 RepID=UPI0022FDBA10|nr:acid phosphatase [Aspergillus affinis]KAI9043266.1 acid phosphatase [Aspergillus affinis]
MTAKAEDYATQSLMETCNGDQSSVQHRPMCCLHRAEWEIQGTEDPPRTWDSYIYRPHLPLAITDQILLPSESPPTASNVHRSLFSVHVGFSVTAIHVSLAEFPPFGWNPVKCDGMETSPRKDSGFTVTELESSSPGCLRHVGVVNDDGPPCSRLSPYILPFVNALQDAGHIVSVAIPAASRSWIGKAHLIEASLKATYVPPAAFRNDATWDEEFESPEESTDDAATQAHNDEWVVIRNGTPASCVQLGLFNLFAERGPFDLVISGPNHGRNTSTIYNLSSGTVGGALEAATCGKRAIAISFGSKDPQPADTIAAASRLAVKLVDHLSRHWDERVELYNLNVPMRADVETRPIQYTRALPYYWARGYLYAEEEPAQQQQQQQQKTTTTTMNGLTNGESLANGVAKAVNGSSSRLKERSFNWSAQLSDMKKALQASEEGTDAHTVLNGDVSVTALRANFWHVPGLDGPLELDN